MAGRSVHAGLFLVSLATLSFEILLTRIFSVTIWNHFAFVAISSAMFGLAAGSLCVYLFPARFPQKRIADALTVCALATGLSMVGAVSVHLSLPFESSMSGLLRLALMYLSVSLPFFFCRITVCLSLTRFPGNIGTLYCADLVGAAFGCLLVVGALELLDAPSAVLLAAVVAASSGLVFSRQCQSRFRNLALGLTVILIGLCAGHGILYQNGEPILRPRWVRGQEAARPLYEEWNSFSHLTVHGNRNSPSKPFGWGLSSKAPDDPVRQLFLTIDGTAGTVLTEFTGEPARLEYLKFDVTNIVHHLRPGSRVLIVGAGGGRDVLAALAFGQSSAIAVEVNQGILNLVNSVFGDFTGHLDRQPGVEFVSDEARSYLERSAEVFDVIQMSLVDTWAATSAGAFVLTESALYTVDAWETVLERLSPSGVFSVSRYYVPSRPAEVRGLLSLATATLARLGVETPRKHMLLVVNVPQAAEGGPPGIGTLLLKRSPFSGDEISLIRTISERMNFRFELGPETKSENADLELVASGADPLDTIPTDDQPFFFNSAVLSDYFNPEHPIFVLTALLLIVVLLVALCILLPLWLTAREGAGQALPLIIYFGAVGAGFMLVEVALLQRFIIFLGHPVYALSVLLFGLLVASGTGSFTTRKATRSSDIERASRGLALLVVLIAVIVFVDLKWFQGWGTWGRILVALTVICPLGLMMGRPVPLGLKIANGQRFSVTPWLWGINGATSVLASVIGVLIALNAGISAVLWMGAASYLVAILVLRRIEASFR